MTVFSFGAGQESTRLLHQIATDPEFRKRHVIGHLLVVGADTGDEHDYTYENIVWAKSFCKQHGIDFYWVAPDMGFHPKTWHSLTDQYKRNASIGSAAFRQSCTDNLKVKVVDNFVESWLCVKHGTFYPSRKNVFYQHIANYGTIRLILGFAKGEEARTSNDNKYDPVWKKLSMDRYYPLLREGIDRQNCINYNEVHIPHKVWPSNCMRCFYQSDQEVLWLFRFRRSKFDEWVQMEAAKLEKYKDEPKNYGVYGKITLIEKLEKAQILYGHWTDEQLYEYKYSHGHCIKSKY